jgi:hypothetical protein
MPHHQDHNESGYGGSDPLVKSRRESASFNVMWLRSPRKMRPVEALGFTVIGIFFTFFGLSAAQGLASDFRENIFVGCFMAAACVGCLYLGLRGLWNVYRSI